MKSISPKGPQGVVGERWASQTRSAYFRRGVHLTKARPEFQDLPPDNAPTWPGDRFSLRHAFSNRSVLIRKLDLELLISYPKAMDRQISISHLGCYNFVQSEP